MNESKVDVTVRQERNILIGKFKEKQYAKMSIDDAAAIEYIRHLSHDFNECFRQLFDDSDYECFNTMGRDAGLTGDTVASYYYGKSKPKTKKSILALISTMYIHPKVGHYLLKTMSWNLESSDNIDDIFYCRLMAASNFKGRGVAKWNCAIIAADHPEWMLPDNAKIEDYQI